MKRYITILISLLVFGSCTDFLTKPPIVAIADDDFWKDENGVRTFAFGFYDLFPGFGNGGGFGDFYSRGLDDNRLNAGGPSTLTNTIPTTSGNWDFTYIRKANILLESVDRANMPDEAKLHWKAFARLFRAWEYSTKVRIYGDVPWFDTFFPEDDPALYRPRDSRTVVMDYVLADFQYAIANLRDNDGANRINKDVARAMMSRACLFEGTFRKYHGIAGSEKFLQASRDASLGIITPAKYTLNPEYRTSYTSESLSLSKEMILYKKYVNGVLMHPTMGYLVSSTTISGLNKFAVESYLCTDGLPITLSPIYQGDDNIKMVLANRDKRLIQTIDTMYAYDGNPFQGTTSTSGYKVIKYVCNEMPLANRNAPYNFSDAPVFWLAEIFLNYAEARAELGELTQADLDMTINLLRSRVSVTPLTLSNVPDDPKRDADVSALLWEIRRERQIELMYDGFRPSDIYRWKKGNYLTTTLTVVNGVTTASINPDYQLGAKVPANGRIVRNEAGYIALNGTRTFLDRNYLEPIPSGQFPLYPEGVLKQNPGW